jgi:hypothetical protein
MNAMPKLRSVNINRNRMSDATGAIEQGILPLSVMQQAIFNDR